MPAAVAQPGASAPSGTGAMQPAARVTAGAGRPLASTAAPPATAAPVPAAATIPAVGQAAEVAEAPQAAPSSAPVAVAVAAASTGSAALPVPAGQPKPAPASDDQVASQTTPPVASPGQAPPVQQAVPTSPASATLPPAPAQPAPAEPAPLAGQVAAPIFTLARAGAGEHVLTVTVTPDDLGPVTVRAHVGGDGIRLDLFAPTDAGRDALRAALPDLRRDLSAGGLSAQLNLSSQNQPSDARGGAPDRAPFAPPERRQNAERAGRGDPLGDGSGGIRRAHLLSTSTIDVLA